jgi:hypothetical protein
MHPEFSKDMEPMNMKVAHSFEGPGTTQPAIRVTKHNTILDYTHVKTLKFIIIIMSLH